MIVDFFIVGSLAFWVLLSGVSVILFYAVDDNRDNSGAFATFIAILTFVALWLFGSFNVFSWAYHNPKSMAIFLSCYFVGGLIWAYVKWYIFNTKLRRKFDEMKSDFLSKNNIVNAEVMTEEQSRKWTDGPRSEFVSSIGNYDRSIIPKVRTHKGLLTMWMTYWPFSLLKTILRDAVQELWETIFEWFHGVLQAVASRKFADADLPEKHVPDQWSKKTY